MIFSIVAPFTSQAFRDHRGKASLKRLITAGAFVLMAVAYLADLMYQRTITQFLYDSMMYIVIAGLGLSLGEAGARRLRKTKTEGAMSD